MTSGTRRRGGATLAIVAATLLATSGCDDDLDPEPLVFVGAPVTLTGRVLGPDESPVAGAEVELCSADLPHDPPRRFGATTSDRDGRFRFEPVPADAINSLTVRAPGSHHRYLVSVPRAASGDQDVGVLHIAPDRALTVVAECVGPLAMEGPRDRPLPVWVEVEWLGHVLARQQLLPPSIAVVDVAPPSEAWRLPGYDTYSRPPPADARRFERRLSLPSGSHRVRVHGGCGPFETQVDIPADGPVPPLVLTLPATEAR